MREWQPKVIPLDRGMGQDMAETSDGVSFLRAVNLDFGRKGAVRGRSGYVRATGSFPNGSWYQIGQNTGAPVLSTQATLAGTGYTAQAMFGVTNRRTEQPALLTNGRIFSMDQASNGSNNWIDRLGATACRVDRVTEYLTNATNNNQPGAFVPPAVAYAAGPGAFGSRMVLLAPSGDRVFEVAGPSQGPGTAAATGVVQVSAGTNNLVFTSIGSAAITSTTIATDAATPQGYGDQPVLCSDTTMVGQGYFVLYKTTTAHQVKLLSLNNTGGVLGSTSITFGTGTINGLWVCNADFNSITRVVVALVDSATGGVYTKIYNASLVDQALDVTVQGALQCWGPVTCGAAQSSLNQVWLTFLGNDGTLRISTRALTAATSVNYASFSGTFYNPGGSASTQGHGWFLQHQPVLVNGRAIAGVAVNRSWSSSLAGHVGATWYCVDLTDLATQGSGVIGSRRSPPMIARGVRDGSGIPWGPVSAVVGSDGLSWRFPTVDWTNFTGGDAFVAIAGYEGSLGVNEVSFQAPQVAHFGNSTVIGGSIPRALSGGMAYEVGFPWLGFPAISGVVSGVGGSWPVGSYTAQCCWKWTDESGQIHRSAPSQAQTLSVGSGQQITLFGSPLQFTDRNYLVPQDRGTVYLEFYITQANPTANAPHYLIATVAAETGAMVSTGAMVGPTDTTQLTLYTDGGVLSNLPVSADGGVATVGRRCWVSDGSFVYASKLQFPGDPPAWNGDGDAVSGGDPGALALALPAAAGRVLSLQPLNDRLLILCERGVYALAGNGPDDLGLNSDFTAPLLISDLGIAGTRCSALTPRGVVFHATHEDLGESIHGGLWLVDPQLQIAQISWPARDAVDSPNPGELTYVPEQGLLVYLVPQYTASGAGLPPNESGGGVGGGTGGTGGGGAGTVGPFLIVWNMHVNAWSVWTPSPDGVLSIASVAGHLWSAGTDVGGFTNIPSAGADVTTGTPTNYTMELQTNAVSAVEDGLGWSRVRSIRVLGDPSAVVPNHNLVLSYIQDGALATNTNSAATKTMVLPQNEQQTTGYPSDRYAPEWRIPHQKCSTIQVDLQANPAVATWTHLELQVKPERRAPAHFRA